MRKKREASKDVQNKAGPRSALDVSAGKRLRIVFRKGCGELCWWFQWIETIASSAVLPAQYLLDLS